MLRTALQNGGPASCRSHPAPRGGGRGRAGSAGLGPGRERGALAVPLPPPPARRVEEEDARELLPPFPGEDAGTGAACPQADPRLRPPGSKERGEKGRRGCCRRAPRPLPRPFPAAGRAHQGRAGAASPPPPRSAEGRRGAGWRGQAAPGELAAPVTALGGAGRGARDGSPVRSHLLERSMRTPEKSFSPSRNETTRASSMM